LQIEAGLFSVPWFLSLAPNWWITRNLRWKMILPARRRPACFELRSV